MFMFLVFSVDHENYDFGLNFAVYQYHFIDSVVIGLIQQCYTSTDLRTVD